MRRVGAIAAVGAMLMLVVAGCGTGGTTTVTRTVTTPVPSPVEKLVLARHDPEAPQHESGGHGEGTNCRTLGGGRVKTIPLRSTTADCYRVVPRDRLLFVNETGIGPDHGEPNPVEVQVGDYRASIGVGKSALFQAPVGSYLRLGIHLVYTDATVQRPSIQVLPEGCSFDHTKLGESLCFAPGAPPCRSAGLAIHAGRGGAAAGTDYEHVLVVNRSERTCTVAGLPQVTPVDAAGRSLGAPFPTNVGTTTMSGNHPRTIALEPGAVATFEMNSGNATNYPRSTCHPRKAAALEVTIPGAGGPPLSLPFGLEICADETNVTVGRIE